MVALTMVIFLLVEMGKIERVSALMIGITADL